MSTTRPMQTADTSVLPVPGRIWDLLQTERQEVCAALLAEPFMIKKLIPEALQMRLRQIDGALDSLSDNYYGICHKCGRPIEHKRLASDLTASLCFACQTPA